MKFKPIVSALLGVVFIVSALYAIAEQQTDNRRRRSDIIVIDSMKVFGDLERPGVTFPHDKHTNALEKQGKDCSTCHQTKDDQLVYKFKRVVDKDQESTLDIYHTDCITCHQDRADADLESGPVECGTCHVVEPEEIAAREAISFDASLHTRHIKAADDKCESCHHGYDADAKKIAYKKGEEDSCRTCHKDETVDDVISYAAASHEQCISCHQEPGADKKIENKLVAANKCEGCHEPAQLEKIVKLDSIPRLDRNQPDLTFVKSFDDITSQMMNGVLFDHQKHEANADNCSTCHHETLNACESCHTLSGVKEGNGITLAQAMHNVESDRSCIGCHTQKTAEIKECAGCHSLVDVKTHISDGQSCRSCHSVPIETLKSDKTSGKVLMAAHYKQTSPSAAVVDIKALPEEILIDVISKEYKGAKFPHRAIVASMMDKITGNAMAAAFHQEKDTVCQSCHHNSPEALDPPPRCISCHASADNEQDGRVPGTKAAYHQQCFDCHEALEMKSPDSTNCTACHEEK